MVTETLVAGPELDAEIARRVFGRDYHPSADTKGLIWDGSRITALPKYSTDIAAAWLVVEKMRELGYSINFGSDADGWEVEMIPSEEQFAQHGYGAVDTEPTAPLAICRAALAALEHD